MNFYDKIHELVHELKKTEEYTTYIKIKDELVKDKEQYSKVKEFKELQKEQHIKYISGEKLEEEKMKELQEIYASLIKEKNIASLFEAEIKLDVILADIQKILAEGIKDIVEF